MRRRLLNDKNCLDCGAGNGRVTKFLLSSYFKSIELIDPIKKFMDSAKKDLKSLEHKNKFQFHTMGLEDFKFTGKKYDCIWSNWSLCFLTDNDCLTFLKQAKTNLRTKKNENRKSGLMFVKENTDVIKLIRPVENQIIRTAENYEKLFEDAGLQVVFKRSQIW